MIVIRKEDETFSSLLNRFKKQEKKDGFWLEIKKRKSYFKPSKERREAKKRGIINTRIRENKKK